jgi:hypothetical protein
MARNFFTEVSMVSSCGLSVFLNPEARTPIEAIQRTAASSGPPYQDEELNKNGRKARDNGRQPLQQGIV